MWPPEKLHRVSEPMQSVSMGGSVGCDHRKGRSKDSTAAPLRKEQTNETMKNYLITTSRVLGLAVIGLLAGSCADMGDGNTHQMGPPGKEHAMGDSAMPSMAR